MKRTLLCILYLMAGLLLGTLLTHIAENVSFLSWLCWGDTIGVGTPGPISVDLSVIRLEFSVTVQLNIARMLCLLAAVFAYFKTAAKIR